jgi:DHA2 family multidrug resistance protein
MAGLLGIFIAAMMAGLNNRIGALALADLRGALGLGADEASWLITAYNAGELIAMPFSAWFALTLSVRRFELWMLAASMAFAVLLAFTRDLTLLLTLRFLQGLACGTMIPLLMMAALKFLPLPKRLYGLALFAMTATFTPNVSLWLAGQWTEAPLNWRWAYWQMLPMALPAAGLIGWGLPREPIQFHRFGEANWFGMACGVLALGLLALALDQGLRLDWLNSPLIRFALIAGMTLLAVYLLSEWYHPAPFIKLQILGRRNLVLGCLLFVGLLVVLMSGSLLPAAYLGPMQNYRPLQMAVIGLTVALPQLLLGFLVALLLYQRWVDARLIFSLGLLSIALACFGAARLSLDWNRDQFVIAQVLQAVGQPMAVISMLFLITSVVKPQEGPYISGTINTLRMFGLLIGAAMVGQHLSQRSRFHAQMLLDHAALSNAALQPSADALQLMNRVGQEALVLSVADAYRVLGSLALLLIPIVLRLTHIPAPETRAPAPSSSATSAAQG